jgi:hypothetical protein
MINNLTMNQTMPQPWMTGQPVLDWRLPPTPLETVSAAYKPISLVQMEAAALLNRVDTKFLLTQEQMLAVLTALQSEYWMISVNGVRLNRYRTLYFDTPSFDLYRMHVNGRAERYKVRSREYTDNSLSFLEIKHKTRKGRTIKSRIPTVQPVVEMTGEAEAWLHTVAPIENGLEAKLWNTFSRITLVGKSCLERVTLDVNLAFQANNASANLGSLVIAELKMDRCGQASPFWAQMRAQHIQPRGFSKYCIGIAMLYSNVKKNSLKPRLLWLERAMRGN